MMNNAERNQQARDIHNDVMQDNGRGLSGTCPSDCSIVLNEGEIVDLTGMEDWLSTMEVLRPRLGDGVRQRWLKTLASILDQSNIS